MDTLRFAPTCFPAPVTHARSIGELTLSETRYGSGAALPTHSHEYACLVFVIEGTFAERCGTVERTASPGMMILRPPGEAHSDRFDRSAGRCLNIEIPPSWHTRALDTSGTFTGSPFDLLGHRLCDELRHADETSPLAVESILLSLLADAGRASRRPSHPPPVWLARAKDAIHDRMSEQFTLAMIATDVGVHPVHLASAFQRFFGQSVGAYVRHLRIGYACDQLRGSDLSLADIALAAGFSDQSHFGRTFKRIMHATPRQYRSWQA